MTPSLSRRTLLLAGAGLVVGAACGGGGSKDDGDAAPAPTSTAENALNAIVASQLLAAGREQRVSFAVLEDRAPLPAGVDVKVAFAPDRGDYGAELTAVHHSDGIEGRPYYAVTTTFPAPGIYGLRARAKGKEAVAAFQIPDPNTSKTPLPGMPLPSVATPTANDHRGVDPICTRDPQCPLHEVSVDTVLAEHRPLALLISTPRFCQSQVCGPVLDVLLSVKDGYEAKGVRFVHAEVYTDETIKTAAPVMRAYGLEVEPVLYLVGGDGVVVSATDGPFDRADARSLLDGLIS